MKITAGHREELIGGGLKRSQSGCEEIRDIRAYDERILGSGGIVEALIRKKILEIGMIERLRATL
ncbi:MAG: hypothetical protein J0665_09240 [Deltaproteobacteria bacterium]|jgi:hypothetical protein|nr:hypothetical protein [Deltaproteobacteria bacterium]